MNEFLARAQKRADELKAAGSADGPMMEDLLRCIAHLMLEGGAK